MSTHPLAAEHDRRASLTDRVEQCFRAHPNTWLNAVDLQRVGGSFASRTRISECRKRGLYIENRQTRTPMADGGVFVESEYRWLPHGQPVGPDASQYRAQDLFSSADAPWR